MNKFYKNLLYISLPMLSLSIIFAIISLPLVSITAMQKSLNLCLHTIIPSLFPFFILSNIILDTKFPLVLGRMLQPIIKPLFNVSGVGSLPIILGMLAGYPTGAKIACDLYITNQLTKKETELLLAYTNNSSPLFIIGSIACSMLNQPAIGGKLLMTHLASSVIVGFILGKMTKISTTSNSYTSLKSAMDTFTYNVKKNYIQIITQAFSKAIETMLLVCSFILFFSVLSALINELLVSMNLSQNISAFILGLVEISNGSNIISALEIPTKIKLSLISFIIGFGGLGVYMQVMAIVSPYKLKLDKYITGKLLQGIVGATMTFFIF